MSDNNQLMPSGETLFDWARRFMYTPADQVPPAQLQAALPLFERFESDKAQALQCQARVVMLLRSIADLSVTMRGPQLRRALDGQAGDLTGAWVEMKLAVTRMKSACNQDLARSLDESLAAHTEIVREFIRGFECLNAGDDGDELALVAAGLSDRLAALYEKRPKKVGKKSRPMNSGLVYLARETLALREDNPGDEWSETANKLLARLSISSSPWASKAQQMLRDRYILKYPDQPLEALKRMGIFLRTNLARYERMDHK